MLPENKKNVPFNILVICYNPYFKIQNTEASIISCTLYNLLFKKIKTNKMFSP